MLKSFAYRLYLREKAAIDGLMEEGFLLPTLSGPRLDLQRALNSFSEMDLAIKLSHQSEKSFYLGHYATVE